MENTVVVKTEYLKEGAKTLAYVRVIDKTDGVCTLDGETYRDIRNDCEPFDFRLHVFELPTLKLEKNGRFTVTLRSRVANGKHFVAVGATESVEIEYDPSKVMTLNEAIERTDRHLTLTGLTGTNVAGSERCLIEVYKTDDGAPVRVYTFVADPAKCDFIAGTPFGETEFVPGRLQTVMEEANVVKAMGHRVLAAVNADFFDMFGDGHPSGLCMTRGKVVANPDSSYVFFGIKKNGEAVIATTKEVPIDELREAVTGRQIIVDGGRVNDTAPLEPFGDVCHPRTAVGIGQDGEIILMVVDGRRPSWSNGASLTELARLMIKHGAFRALNLDGGGSSTFIVEMPDGLQMLNHPADLERPMEDLIRPLFDTIVVVKKD